MLQYLHKFFQPKTRMYYLTYHHENDCPWNVYSRIRQPWNECICCHAAANGQRNVDTTKAKATNDVMLMDATKAKRNVDGCNESET